ncbi:MAG: ABC transporter substrate-binding protein [Armatimonadetes bacterium]|nr:ABC transporter substrate-binding protein [Armatimonadota bacterium]
MNTKLAALSLFALGAMFLGGCGSSTTTEEPAKTPEAKANTTTPGSAAGDLDAKGLKLGFAQVGAESGWRTANTESIKAEAQARGVDLKFADAQQKQENQIKAIKSFIAQGVDVIAFSPVVETGWEPVLQEAKKAGIPVIISDRRADVPDDLYATFIGSDFIKEGQMAGDWLAKKLNNKGNIAELTGTPGSAPANDRAKGFRQALEGKADLKIVFTQTGDFTRAKGKEVMEALMKSPTGSTLNAVFAHNDDMALGAIQAIEEAGKKPGSDIIVVSIDGVHDAFQAMVDGKLNCTVECNPLLGKAIIDAAAKVKKGETLPKRTVIEDGIFDQSVAAKELPNRKY